MAFLRALAASVLTVASTLAAPGPTLLPSAAAQTPIETTVPPRAQQRPPRASAQPTQNVVLVSIDGVRWQEVFHGVDADLAKSKGVPATEVRTAEALMPNLHQRIIANGVAIGPSGTPMLSPYNALSLPGYIELMSGRSDSPCDSNKCPQVSHNTIIDQVRKLPQVKQSDVVVVSSWEMIERAATRQPYAIEMSLGRHYGLLRDKLRVDEDARNALDRGEKAGPFPGHEDYRPDRFTSTLALSVLKAKKPKLLYVSLGDTDEHGHRDDYASYLHSLRDFDAFLGDVCDALDEMGEYGARTTIIVTTDHGRGDDFAPHGRARPESKRIWMAASGGSVPAQGIVAPTESYRLADIAPTIRAYFDMPADRARGAGKPITELLPKTSATPLAAR